MIIIKEWEEKDYEEVAEQILEQNSDLDPETRKKVANWMTSVELEKK